MPKRFAFALIVAMAIPCYGYEKDVHYGLTYWLARKAGFSAGDAKQIASADESLDEGTSAPAPWAVLHILISGDITNYNLVRNNHFPSDAVQPSDPEKRIVTVDGPAANSEAKDAVNDSTDGRTKEAQLWKLGTSLHPLQDSWSHQGVPDIPFRPVYEFRPQLSYGHPCLRGGWYSHDADLTYLHVADTVAMADKVYSYLTDFLSHRPDLRTHSPSDWSDLKASVTEFASASSKRAKYAWFRGDPQLSFDDYGDPNLVSALDLPDIEASRNSIPENCANPHRNAFDRFRDALADVPAGVMAAVRDALQSTDAKDIEVDSYLYQFLKTWLVDRDFMEAGKQFDLRGLRYELKEMHIPEAQAAKPEDILQSWLVQDHGLVNAYGHGILAESSAKLLAETRSTGSLMKFDSVESALDAPQWPEIARTHRPYVLESNKSLGMSRAQLHHQHLGTPTYVAAFGLQRLSHDLLILYISRQQRNWKIERFYWLAL